MLYESKSFRLENRDRVVTLWLDLRNRTTHSLTRSTLNELSLVVDRIAALPPPDVVVIRSSRPGVFLDDFASEEWANFTSPLEFAAVARRGQEVAQKISMLKSPTIAIIEGRCRGAGLELALACDFRVALDSPETTFDHPAIECGLIPCWGGTVRLTRLTGLRAAWRLLTSTSSICAAAAKSTGFVDAIAPPSTWRQSVDAFIDHRCDNPHRRRNTIRRVQHALLDWPFTIRLRQGELGAQVDAGMARVELGRALLAGLSSTGEGLAAERAAVSRLGDTQETKHLLALNVSVADTYREHAEPLSLVPIPQRIGVVGGSDRGVELAIHLACRGHEVAVQTIGMFEATEFPRRVARRLQMLAQRQAMSTGGTRAIQRLIRSTTEWTGFDNADLVFECATEDPGVKRNVYQDLESRVRPRVILATCSKAVPLELIQAEMARPGRAVGFCVTEFGGSNPIAEIVATSMTTRETRAAISQWARRWNLVSIPVADRPGRLIGRVRLAYLSEGVRLVSEGLPIEKIDSVLRQFGMVRGPLEWCDEIGLDLVAEQTAHLQMALHEGFSRNLLFERLLAHRIVGKATDEGFYRYGHRVRPNQIARAILWQDLNENEFAPYVFDPMQSVCDGVERVVLRTVNEAALALPDEPDSDPALVDAALALGMGWAPQRGGPLRYADAIGLLRVVERLNYFAERYGDDYLPCDELIRRAEAGESFHGESRAVGQPAWRMVG